ncbi:hypothetical protein BD779DRAFT_1538977 [Infundibulicybe gibba]|nr:hypothetical protein BD779DRAFT_1538977 [Infundibulicybe gibba]
MQVSEVSNDEQFFAITGIKFMDELSASRRSIHHASHRLSLYTRVLKDLRARIQESNKDFVQVEDKAEKTTPIVHRIFKSKRR